MLTTLRIARFTAWIDGLKDRRGAAKVAARIARVEAGLLGDVKFFEGIGELRIDFGPGYRSISSAKAPS